MREPYKLGEHVWSKPIGRKNVIPGFVIEDQGNIIRIGDPNTGEKWSAKAGWVNTNVARLYQRIQAETLLQSNTRLFPPEDE